MSDNNLDLILHRHGDGYALWACRGTGKGCKRNRFRTAKEPCDDCKGPLDENLTLAEVQQQLEHGDG